MNIVFPMAGRGHRFAREGFAQPKPMIDVMGQPMIERVLACYPADAQYIFVVLREHLQHGLDALLLRLRPRARILPIDEVTEGSACTVLLTREHIDNDDELLIADCDSVLVWPDRWVFDWFKSRGAAGGVTTRITQNPACSYAALDDRGWVLETREKDPFTMFSTTGPYWWRHGADFVKGADAMIAANRRSNGEFYICPVYNHLLASGGRVLSYPLPEFWSLGTPEDLAQYIGVASAAVGLS